LSLLDKFKFDLAFHFSAPPRRRGEARVVAAAVVAVVAAVVVAVVVAVASAAAALVGVVIGVVFVFFRGEGFGEMTIGEGGIHPCL